MIEQNEQDTKEAAYIPTGNDFSQPPERTQSLYKVGDKNTVYFHRYS